MHSELKKRRIILALVLLLIIGIVIALAIILPRFKSEKNVVATIKVQASTVTNGTKYIESAADVNFVSSDESTSVPVADIIGEISHDTYISYEYQISNTGADMILYELTVNTTTNENCQISYAVQNLTDVHEYGESIIGTIQSSESVVIIIDIKLFNPSNDARFEGNIGLKLSVV